MNLFPHEISIGGVYMPPEFLAALLGLILALITSQYLNKYQVTKKFFYPPLVMISMVVIYTIFIGLFIPF
jgi:hypothetical protein